MVFRAVRFLVGFSVVAVTCVLALDRAVWREQIPILVGCSVLAGILCAISDKMIKAILEYWTI